jgi:hypothetical protein
VNASAVSSTDTREVVLALIDIVSNAGTIELVQVLEDATKFYDLISDLLKLRLDITEIVSMYMLAFIRIIGSQYVGCRAPKRCEPR